MCDENTILMITKSFFLNEKDDVTFISDDAGLGDERFSVGEILEVMSDSAPMMSE